MPDKAPSIFAYRIGDGRFPLFDGRGAMVEGARWNSPGHPVIYASLSQAGAMLEMMAHASIGKLPRYSQMISIEIPKALGIEELDVTALPGWDRYDYRISQQYGDEWIVSNRSVALIVPSVVARHDCNIVINQRHPNFPKIIARDPESLQWDDRLFKDFSKK